jgi:phosphoglycolate phosphatase
MFKTVLFDLDGTLLNTIDDLCASGNRLCAARGWPQHTVAQFKYFVGNGIPRLVERLTPEAQRTPEVLASAYRDFDGDYSAHMRDKTAPYPGLPQMLARLKSAGVRMAVYSNKDDALARSVVEYYYDASMFCVVRGALPGVPHKPAPQGTLALMQAAGAQPGSTLYVGDSDVDVATAKNAGLPCCGVLWGFRTQAELTAAGADFLAADAAALERVVLGG